jgi:hypothetical protein
MLKPALMMSVVPVFCRARPGSDRPAPAVRVVQSAPTQPADGGDKPYWARGTDAVPFSASTKFSRASCNVTEKNSMLQPARWKCRKRQGP